MTVIDLSAAASLFSTVNTLAREDPNPRDWYFTFGAGHRAYASSSSYPLMGKGFSLANRYVVINGTFTSARERMLEIFGQVWCAQYGTPQSAGVEEFGLTELVVEPTRFGEPNDIDATGRCCCNGCAGEGLCDLAEPEESAISRWEADPDGVY